MNEVVEFWVYLSASSLLWLTATLAAYLLGHAAFQASGERPAVYAVLIAILLLGGALTITETPYAIYFEGAQFVHFLLGPATVALAIPLWFNRHAIRRALIPMAAALIAGSLTAVIVAIGVAAAFGASIETLLSQTTQPHPSP